MLSRVQAEVELTPQVAARFWSHVDRSGGPDACWLWHGSRLPKGYGQFGLAKGHLWLSHRMAWLLFGRELVADRQLCHSCDNPPCCNPAHLFLGTQSDNVSDSVAKGRHYSHSRSHRGEDATNVKLTNAAVLSIRQRSAEGERRVRLAAEYGVSAAHISSICLRHSWTHI